MQLRQKKTKSYRAIQEVWILSLEKVAIGRTASDGLFKKKGVLVLPG